eukprot:m.189838 g.189838  ORF g.189838 m.189838 type:complete len:291 (+) comp32388_c2_seq2:1945-2817(+)
MVLILVSGGWGQKSAEIYHVGADTWVDIGDLPEERAFHTSAAIAGTAYIVGGQDGQKKMQGSVFRYYPHPKHPGWVECAPLKAPRYGHGLVVMDRKLLAIGGFTDQGDRKIIEDKPTSSVEVYDAGANMWRKGPDVPNVTSSLGCVSLRKHIYAIGDDIACKFSMQQAIWEEITPPHQRTRNLGLATAGGFIYAIGGYIKQTGVATNRVEKYDRVHDVWVNVAPLMEARHSMACTAEGNFIYVCGGTTNGKEAVNTVEVYDTQTDEWSALPSMLKPRGGAAAVAIAGSLS